MIIEILQLLSCFALGLLVGGLLTEGFILVPYWRTMDPQEFLKLHSAIGPRLFLFFAPLTIAATIFPVLVAVFPFVLSASFRWLAVIPAIIVLLMQVIYFAYFKGANESFKSGSVGVEGLPDELSRWAKWHTVRIVLGLAAFAISLSLLL